MKRDEIIDAIDRLSMAYGNQTYAWRGRTEHVVDLWCEHFADMPDGLTLAAVRLWIGTEDTMPTISQIRRSITSRLNPIISEGDAWSLRNAYFRGDAFSEKDAFALRVFKSIGSPRDLGAMPEDQLRTAFGFEYRRMLGDERVERTAQRDHIISAPQPKALS